MQGCAWHRFHAMPCQKNPRHAMPKKIHAMPKNPRHVMPKKSMSESNGIVGSKKGSFLTAFVSPVFRLLKSESVGILCSNRMIFDQFQFPANFYSNRLTGWPISVCGVIACRSDPRFLPPPLPSATLATKSIDYSGILGVILPTKNSIFPEFLSILKDRSY